MTRQNPYLKVQEFKDELNQKLNLQNLEKPIVDQYWYDIHQKIPKTLPIPRPETNINKIREIVLDEIKSIVLDNQERNNIVNHLSQKDELGLFYKIGRNFLHKIQGVRDLDSTYFLQLWNRYKTNLSTSISTASVGTQVTTKPRSSSITSSTPTEAELAEEKLPKLEITVVPGSEAKTTKSVKKKEVKAQAIKGPESQYDIDELKDLKKSWEELPERVTKKQLEGFILDYEKSIHVSKSLFKSSLNADDLLKIAESYYNNINNILNPGKHSIPTALTVPEAHPIGHGLRQYSGKGINNVGKTFQQRR